MEEWWLKKKVETKNMKIANDDEGMMIEEESGEK